MLDQTFERFPGQVQAVEIGITPFQPGDDAQRLGIVIEAAIGLHQAVELALAGMAEGRVAEVMGKGQGLGQVLIQAQRPGDRARDLRHLDRMGQPRPVMVALVIDEDLRLVLQPAEGRGMDDPVAVAREGRARRACPAPAPAARGLPPDLQAKGAVNRCHRGHPLTSAVFVANIHNRS